MIFILEMPRGHFFPIWELSDNLFFLQVKILLNHPISSNVCSLMFLFSHEMRTTSGVKVILPKPAQNPRTPPKKLYNHYCNGKRIKNPLDTNLPKKRFGAMGRRYVLVLLVFSCLCSWQDGGYLAAEQIGGYGGG